MRPNSEVTGEAWWYMLMETRLGPVTRAQLVKLHIDGIIGLDTLVWEEGMRDWQPLGQVGEIRSDLLIALRKATSEHSHPVPSQYAPKPKKVVTVVIDPPSIEHPSVTSIRVTSQLAQLDSDKAQSSALHEIADTSSLGTNWLKFWNYVSLPVGGVLGLFISFSLAPLGLIWLPIPALQFVVAYGLHLRKLWAWQWNWVLIVIAYISMVLPILPSVFHRNAVDLSVQFVIRAVFGALIWMWPNHVYWKRRRPLFSKE